MKIVGYIVAFSSLLMVAPLPRKIEKKINRQIEKTYDVQDVTRTVIHIPATINNQLNEAIGEEQLFKIEKDSAFVCYAYIDKAPSKTAEFDYLVLFNNQLEITGSSVMIYREEYGGEIGSRRWLKQFIGKKPGDPLEYRTDIDGISGATISVRSMTRAVGQFLSDLQILRDNNIL